MCDRILNWKLVRFRFRIIQNVIVYDFCAFTRFRTMQDVDVSLLIVKKKRHFPLGGLLVHHCDVV